MPKTKLEAVMVKVARTRKAFPMKGKFKLNSAFPNSQGFCLCVFKKTLKKEDLELGEQLMRGARREPA